MRKVQKTRSKRISILYPLINTLNEGKTNDNKENKFKVAAYCRVSSNNEEQIISYNAQIKYFEKYIKEKPEYTLVGIYADEGTSGTDIKKRKAFIKLMKDARNKKIDMIITKSLSRFGRNTLECLNSIRELKELGVDVFFEKENIHTKNSEGEMLITLLLAVAQNESQAMSQNIKWGIHRRYECGYVESVPSGKFFGYYKDKEGNLVVDENQGKVVKRIYEEFLNGYGYYQIAKRLTEEEITTEIGNEVWSWSTLKKILTNEKYKGDTLFQKTFNADYLTKKRVKNTGQLPSYYYENTHTNIIDKDIWECVQLEFERQAKMTEEHKMYKYHQHSEMLPFSGKMFCIHCGKVMVRKQSKRKEDKGEYYWCCKRYREGRCKPVPKDACTNGIRIKDKEPEQIFIKAWNELVKNKAWQKILSNRTILQQYKLEQLTKLIEDHGKINKMTYELMLKTLDYIEIGTDDIAIVSFLAGVRINIKIENI
ncbi:recombinase family protein [Clostridium tarantellae]|uniref:Recombinase family protein n=1 Tax=Clostridium tarantellae TaxID=39493 RepID=A0A6I1MLE0_9CLOT|nr:recombinase family protein [Clostridium tarantellae]MPQ43830.1 recombinase family protein [Clostridium tarantellae]